VTRIALTGFGAVTPLGIGADATWEALRSGVSGIRELPEHVAGNAPVTIGGLVDPSFVDALSVPERRRLDPVEQFTLLAGREAWDRAGRPSVDPDRLATVVGTGCGGVGTLLAQDKIRAEAGPRRVTPHMLTMFMPNGPSAWLSMALGARGGAFSATTACAAGAEAIATGVRMIRAGLADIVVSGGSEASLNPMFLTGYAQIRALSTNRDAASASRPFDKDRDGFALADGAVMIVLESEDHARARGATIYGFVDGVAVTSDAHEITNADPSNQARTMTMAMEDAGAVPADIGVVHAHATSTPAGDLNESTAITKAKLAAPVTAVKSMTGHCVGAAGALTAMAAILTLHHGLVPPTINVENQDPRVPHEIVTKPQPINAETALVNSFGFGGQNAALVVRRS